MPSGRNISGDDDDKYVHLISGTLFPCKATLSSLDVLNELIGTPFLCFMLKVSFYMSVALKNIILPLKITINIKE